MIFPLKKVGNPAQIQPFFINQEKSFINPISGSACQNILSKQKKHPTLLNRKATTLLLKADCYEQ
jgi:hypothetical protein